MGDELVSNSSPTGGTDKTCTPFDIYDIIKATMPVYLALGMTSDEYWNCDPIVYGAYRQAQEIKWHIRNNQEWLMGRYVYDAIGALAPVLRNNMSGQTVKASPYLSEPYPINKKELEDKQEEQAKQNMETMRARLLAFADKYNARGGVTNGNE